MYKLPCMIKHSAKEQGVVSTDLLTEMRIKLGRCMIGPFWYKKENTMDKLQNHWQKKLIKLVINIKLWTNTHNVQIRLHNQVGNWKTKYKNTKNIFRQNPATSPRNLVTYRNKNKLTANYKINCSKIGQKSEPNVCTPKKLLNKMVQEDLNV